MVPFGFGLSYASLSFAGNASRVVHTTVATAASQPLCFDVDVINEDSRAGHTSDATMLGFVHSKHGDAPRNGKLCDFVREAAIVPGERRSVRLCVGTALPLVDDHGHERVLPGEYVVRAGVHGGVGGKGAGAVVGKVVVSES